MNEQPSHVAVALDGPSAAGKSSIARAAAAQFGFVYLDTGAIYRTVGLAAKRAGLDAAAIGAADSEPANDTAAEPAAASGVAALLPELQIEIRYDAEGVQHMLLNGADVSREIRAPEIARYASAVSALPEVRRFLLEMQRSVARAEDVIMDGRDIGTVVLPDAAVKIFLTAAPEARARRRWLELREQGRPEPLEQVLRETLERDEKDMSRDVAPLRPAEDAVTLDTSELDFPASVAAVCEIISRKTGR